MSGGEATRRYQEWCEKEVIVIKKTTAGPAYSSDPHHRCYHRRRHARRVGGDVTGAARFALRASRFAWSRARMSGALRSRVAGASRDDPLDEDASVVLSTEQQEAVVADLEATAGRAASAWRVAVGVLAVTGGAYFAMLAARAAWSGDVDVWRGVRDPKRPTTRRAVASSARLSPPPRLALALPSPLTFPAPSPSPAHPPGCPHRVLRPPRARDIPRAPRAPRRAHRPRAHPRRDRHRVPR